MPVLKNQKHERFAQAVAMGMPAAEAYRRHVARNPDSIGAEQNGYLVANRNDVAIRIQELREKVAAKVEAKFDMTKEKWLDELRQIATEARQTGDFSAASGALAHIGKASSFFDPEKHQLDVIVTIGGNQDTDSQD